MAKSIQVSIRVIFFFLFFLDGTALFAKGFLSPLKKDRGPIDIVYTWVDGQDHLWQKKRDKTAGEYKAAVTCEARVKSRFRNRDELKYSLRSVYKYANFVNHIYIVTAEQTPYWLQSHPMVTIVHHKTIFSDHSHLPTFNSHAIEANLHKIPGLSERFIYLNDDVLLNRRVKENHFFSKRGKVKIFVSKSRAKTGIASSKDIGFFAGWKNNNYLLDSLFKKKRRYNLEHAPFALKKSHIRQFEALLPEVFQRNSSHKFRSPEDFAMINGLIQYFIFHHGQAQKARFRSPAISIGANVRRNRRLLGSLKKTKPHAFCLQDIANIDNPIVDNQLQQFLEERFPEKAPWEY